MPKQKLSRRERLIEDRKRLEQESKRLRSEVSKRDQQVQQVRGDASIEVQRIQSEYSDTQLDAETIREQAIHDLFKDILAGPAQISLIRLLTMDDDTDQRWLLPLVYYLRDQVGLSLIGEKDEIITLTSENCDAFTIDEHVSLPCEVRISKRGFAIGETIIQRPEVTTQLEG
jgi:hypothetical protein